MMSESNKQPECTSFHNIAEASPTSSLAVEANAQRINPLNVMFTVLEHSLKMEIINILSNPNTLQTGNCINSCMVIIFIILH